MMFAKKGRVAAAMSVMLAILVPLAALAAPQVKDVPKGHWAYEAVMKLVDKGYLGVYDDGAFKGDETVSRYLLAFVVAKMLTDIEKGSVVATSEDMSVLREVANELRGEIVPLMSALDIRVKALEGQGVDGAKALTAERQERKAEAAELLGEFQGQADRIKAIGEAMDSARKGINALENSLAAEKIAKDKLINAIMVEDKADKDTIAKSIAALEASRIKTDAELGSLSRDVTALKAALGADIDKAVAELSAYLEKESQGRKALESALETIRQKAAVDLAKAVRTLEEADKANYEDLMKASDALKGYLKAEADERVAADADLAKKLAELDSKLVAYIQEATLNRKALDEKLDAQGRQAADELTRIVKKLEEADIFNAEEIVKASKAAEESIAALGLKTEDDLASAVKRLDAADKANAADMLKASEALKDYMDAEARQRAAADESLSTRLAELDRKLGANMEKAAAELLDAITAETQARKSGNDLALVALAEEKAMREESVKNLDAKITALRKSMEESDFNTTALILKVASEQAARDDGFDASIASLRKAMDTANLAMNTIKTDLAALAGRVGTLETSVAVIKSNLESAVTQLVTVKNDLATLTLKHNTLDAKVAALQADMDAKFRKSSDTTRDLIDSQAWEAQEREKALKAQVMALEMQIGEKDKAVEAQMKKLQGFGIVGIVLGVIGAIVGIVAIFLPVAPTP